MFVMWLNVCMTVCKLTAWLNYKGPWMHLGSHLEFCCAGDIYMKKQNTRVQPSIESCTGHTVLCTTALNATDRCKSILMFVSANLMDVVNPVKPSEEGIKADSLIRSNDSWQRNRSILLLPQSVALCEIDKQLKPAKINNLLSEQNNSPCYSQ